MCIATVGSAGSGDQQKAQGIQFMNLNTLCVEKVSSGLLPKTARLLGGSRQRECRGHSAEHVTDTASWSQWSHHGKERYVCCVKINFTGPSILHTISRRVQIHKCLPWHMVGAGPICTQLFAVPCIWSCSEELFADTSRRRKTAELTSVQELETSWEDSGFVSVGTSSTCPTSAASSQPLSSEHDSSS